MTSVLIRREGTDSQGESHVAMETEIGVHPRMSRVTCDTRNQERGGERLSLGAFGESRPR